MIRALLADDQRMMRTLLGRVCQIEEDIELVGVAATGEEALSLAERIRPDVAVLDIKLPGISGLEVARRLRRRLPTSRIVVLTGLDSYGFAARALAAGANAFLTKHAAVNELATAIRMVHQGRDYIDLAMAQSIALAHVRNEHSPIEQLSDREMEVLFMMLQGHTALEISGMLALAPKTVEHHRRSIRQKFHAQTDAQLGVLAARYGFDPLGEVA